MQTVDANVSTVLEPLNKHLETFFCQLLSETHRLLVLVAEVTSGVVGLLAGPAPKDETQRGDFLREHTSPGSSSHVSFVVDRH